MTFCTNQVIVQNVLILIFYFINFIVHNGFDRSNVKLKTT